MGDKVRASHLLVKHRESRNPSSWKEPSVTRRRSFGYDPEFRKSLTDGLVDFEDLASRESHCSSAKRGGDLGVFGRGQMQKPFEDATYALKSQQEEMACLHSIFTNGYTRCNLFYTWPCCTEVLKRLKVGELSQPVFTDSGVHLILRTA